MKIRLTESQYLRLINESGIEEYKNLSEEQWDKVWLELRKFNDYKTFNMPEDGFYVFGGLFFFLDEDEGCLQLPPQKLSDWSRYPERALEILNNYVRKLESILTNSNLGLVLNVEPNYSMKIYKTN